MKLVQRISQRQRTAYLTSLCERAPQAGSQTLRTAHKFVIFWSLCRMFSVCRGWCRFSQNPNYSTTRLDDANRSGCAGGVQGQVFTKGKKLQRKCIAHTALHCVQVQYHDGGFTSEQDARLRLCAQKIPRWAARTWCRGADPLTSRANVGGGEDSVTVQRLLHDHLPVTVK